MKMASSIDDLKRAESEIEDQERALREEEEQLHAQELAIGEMEEGFAKRNNMLSNLAGYVDEQEKNLLSRASAMGDQARQLVEKAIGDRGGLSLDNISALGAITAREQMLQTRQRLLEERLALVEERSGLYATRMEAIDNVEGVFGELEAKILDHERVIADALRSLMTGALDLPATGAPTRAPAPAPTPTPAPAPAPKPVVQEHVEVATPAPEPPAAEPEPPVAAEPEEEAFDLPIISAEELEADEPAPTLNEATHQVEGTEPVSVISGEGDGLGTSPDLTGPHSPAEDTASQARQDNAPSDSFNITLEADLINSNDHTFFRYAEDDPDELPGLFLATDRRIMVDRRSSSSTLLANSSISYQIKFRQYN